MYVRRLLSGVCRAAALRCRAARRSAPRPRPTPTCAGGSSVRSAAAGDGAPRASRTIPATYYFGAAAGGVWKTEDAGRTWSPIFDRAGSASVGALAVAPSNPKVIYVGTGQIQARYDIALGRRRVPLGRRRRDLAARRPRATRARSAASWSIRTTRTSRSSRRSATSSARTASAASSAPRTAGRPGTRSSSSTRAPAARTSRPIRRIPTIVYASLWQVRNYPVALLLQADGRPGQRHLQVDRRRPHAGSASRAAAGRRRRSAGSASRRRRAGASGRSSTPTAAPGKPLRRPAASIARTTAARRGRASTRRRAWRSSYMNRAHRRSAQAATPST